MSYILPLEELVNSGSNSNCFQHSSIKSISFSWNKINPFLGSLSAFNMNTSFAFLQWKRDSSATYRYKLSFEGPKSELTIVAEMGLFDDNVVLGLWFTKKRFRLRKFIYIYIYNFSLLRKIFTNYSFFCISRSWADIKFGRQYLCIQRELLISMLHWSF